MLTYTLFEIRRTLRNFPFLLYTIVFPVGIYLLFSSMFSGNSGQAHAFQQHYMVSMALYATMAVGLTGVSAQIAFERRGGWTRLLALTPLRPASYLVIKVGASVCLTLPAIGLVMAAGGLVGGVRLPLGSWFALVPLLWLGSLPFTALGIAIGYTFRDEAANGVSVACLFLFSLAGGLWIPSFLYPSWLKHLSAALPSYRAGELGWRLVNGDQPFSTGATVFFAWLVALLLVAGWRFRKAS